MTQSDTLSALSALSFMIAVTVTPWGFLPAGVFLIAAVVVD